MAQKYNIDINKIRKANNVGTGGIYIGTGNGNRESFYAVRGTGNGSVCIYDKVLYELVMTNLTNIEPNGGTYSSASYAKTNKKTHGNGVVETGLALNATGVTIPVNTSTAETKSGSVTVAQYDSEQAAYNGASVAWTWTQQKDYPTAIELTISPKTASPQIAAAGGSVSTALTNFNYSVKCTFKSGNVVNNFTGATITANVTGVTAASKGTVISSITTAGTITFTASYTCNGKTVTNAKSVDITQAANAITAYGNPYGITLSCPTIPASGGTVTVSPNTTTVSQQVTYTSTATATTSTTATFTWSPSQSVTAQSLGTTEKAETVVANVTATYTANGKSSTASIGVKQEANTIVSYSVPAGITASCSDIPAAGGTVTATTNTTTASQTATYTSKSSKTVTGTATISWSPRQTASAATLGSTVKARTQIATLTATYTLNGKSSTTSVNVYQAANSITYGNPAFTLSPGSSYVIPASGGSVTGGVSSVSQTRTFTSTYSDTITLTANASTNGYTVAWTGQTQTANSKGSTVSNATSVGTISAKVTSTNGGSTTKSCSVTQAANAITATAWDDPTFTLLPGTTVLPASGGSVTGSVSGAKQKYTYTYTSKATSTGETTTGLTTTWTGQTQTAASRGTTTGAAQTIGTTTAKVSGSGSKSTTKSYTVTQEKNEAVSTGWGTITGNPTGSCADISAAGGTVTATTTTPQTLAQNYTTTYTSKATSSSSSNVSCTVAYVGGNTATANSLGSTVKARTNVKNLTLRATGNGGVTKDVTIPVYQAANNVSYGNPTFDLGPGSSYVLPASGGSVTGGVSNVKQTRTFTSTYSDTITLTANATTNGYTVAWTGQTQTANSRMTTTGASVSIGTITAKVTSTNGGSTTKSCSVTQEANAIVSTTWQDPTFTLSPGNTTLPASGGSVTGSVSNAKQAYTYTYTSKSTSTGETTSGLSTAWTGQTQTAASRGTTTGAVQTIGTTTARVTGNGSKYTNMAYTVTQEANAVISTVWQDPTFTLSPGNTTLPASGGSVTGSVSEAKQAYTYTYTSKSTSTGETTSGLSTAWTGQTQTAASRGTTTGAAQTIGTTTAKVTGNGSKSTSKSYTVSQEKNEVVATTWGNVTGNPTGSCPTIPASGGTVTATASSPQTLAQSYTYTYTSKATSNGSSNVSCTVAFVGGNTATANSLGSTVKAQTQVATLTIRATGNGSKTKDASIPAYQAANSVAYDNPTFDLSPGSSYVIPASGGSITGGVSNVKQGRTFTSKYSDTITLTLNASTNGYTVAWTGQTQTANSRGTTTGTSISVGTITARVTSTNGGSASKSCTVTQQANSVSRTYGNPVPVLSNPGTIASGGGSVTVTVTACTQSYTDTYTSKSTSTGSISTVSSFSYSWTRSNTAFTISPTTGTSTTVSIGANGSISQRSTTVTATATLNGKSGSSEPKTVTQAGKSALLTPRVISITASVVNNNPPSPQYAVNIIADTNNMTRSIDVALGSTNSSSSIYASNNHPTGVVEGSFYESYAASNPTVYLFVKLSDGENSTTMTTSSVQSGFNKSSFSVNSNSWVLVGSATLSLNLSDTTLITVTYQSTT